MHAWSKGIVGGLACGLVALAQAATITHVSPQGEVASVQQVAIRFFTGVVTLGDARAIDPAVLTCEGVVPPGGGRWSSDREWLYDFEQPL